MDKKENIFIKLIKKIFKGENQKLLPEKTEIIGTEQDTKSKFLEEIRLYKEEDEALLKLQSQYENREIDLTILSSKQLHDLSSLYERQVSELKKRLKDKKEKISMMQHQIKIAMK